MTKRKDYTPEQIIMKLRIAEVLLSKEKSTMEVCHALELSEQNCYRWRKEYGELDTTPTGKTKELEKVKSRLKNPVVGLLLDNAVLQEVLSKK